MVAVPLRCFRLLFILKILLDHKYSPAKIIDIFDVHNKSLKILIKRKDYSFTNLKYEKIKQHLEGDWLIQ